MHVLAVGPDGTLYAAGEKPVNGYSVAFVASWQGDGWKDIGVSAPGVAPGNSAVWSMTVDGKGRIFIGGMFLEIAGVKASYAAMYDGKNWSGLPGALDAMTPVTALTTAPDGTVYVGGLVTLNNGIAYSAMLANGKWSLMPGIDYQCHTLNPCMGVLEMTVDAGGTLRAAGQFSIGSTVTGYATWNGSTWVAQPTGGMGIGTAIAVDDDGSVFVCLGDQPGGSRWMVARMGNPVTALGTPGPGDGVYALVVHGGVAYAAFSTTNPGDNTAPWQIASFAIPTKTTSSALPRNIEFGTGRNGKPMLTWKAPAFLRPQSYAVQYRLVGSGEWRDARVVEGRRQAVLPSSYAGKQVDVRVKARGGSWRAVTLVAST